MTSPRAKSTPALTLPLRLDGVGMIQEHVHDADRHGDADAARQDAPEHSPRPAVLDQQQVEDQQFRVQRSYKCQGEELSVHGRSADIPIPRQPRPTPQTTSDTPLQCAGELPSRGSYGTLIGDSNSSGLSSITWRRR
jgi:hypothetical protein